MHSPLSPNRSRRRGIALTELLLAVSVLGVMTGVAVNVFPGLRASADAGRLEKDVKTLNLAVTTYLNSGGQIPANATPDTILAKLKSSPTATTAKTLVGLKGSMLDMRLKGKHISSSASGTRIVWDPHSLSFRLAATGEGWSEMTVDNSEVTMTRAADNRRTSLAFASVEPWVWDYIEAGQQAHGPSNIPVNDPTVGQPVLVDPTFQLLPPIITPASGIVDYHDFPLEVTIENPNPRGMSNVRYQVDGAGWNTLGATELHLSRELTHTVRAFAEGLDGETWQQSATVTTNYVSYFIRGQADADFVSPAGESRLEQVVGAGGRLFQWGHAQSSGQTQSSLEFIPGTAFEVGPEEDFTVATVRYVNGVSRAGTNATSVTASISLPLSVPSGTTVTVNMPVRMQNTVHYAWTPASDYKDYVWVPDTLPVVAPVMILDRLYRVTLRTSAAGSIQDGTDLKIPVGEGLTADVTITARLDPL